MIITIVMTIIIIQPTCVCGVCVSPGSNQHGSIQGHTTVTSGSLLDDDHWHSVVIERYRRNINFTLDHHTQHFRTNGEFDHLDLDYEVGDLLHQAVVSTSRVCVVSLQRCYFCFIHTMSAKQKLARCSNSSQGEAGLSQGWFSTTSRDG